MAILIVRKRERKVKAIKHDKGVAYHGHRQVIDLIPVFR